MVTEIGKNPVSELKHQIHYVENQRADAGREHRTRLARPYSQAQAGFGEKINFLFS